MYSSFFRKGSGTRFVRDKFRQRANTERTTSKQLHFRGDIVCGVLAAPVGTQSNGPRKLANSYTPNGRKRPGEPSERTANQLRGKNTNPIVIRVESCPLGGGGLPKITFNHCYFRQCLPLPLPVSASLSVGGLSAPDDHALGPCT